MGRINETLLILGFQGWVLQVTCLSLWFWTAGLGTRQGWAPKADPIPRFQVCCGLTFHSSRAEPTWSWRESSNGYKAFFEQLVLWVSPFCTWGCEL